MVLETIALISSWHPGHEKEYNAFNPGLIINAKVEETRDVEPFVTVGGYYDSYKKLSCLAGIGCDFGDEAGMSMALAHVTGSKMGKYPAVLIPSFFYRSDNYAARLIFSPGFFAFGVSYIIKTK